MRVAQVETKAVVTVATMARMAGLSRSRFYQLIGTAFPHPVYDVTTRRPLYTEESQKVCLEVRRRNCGIDGKPILFYARRPPASAPARSRTAIPRPAPVPHADVLDGVKALGLSTATAADVRVAISELYPTGIAGHDSGEVLRAVFLCLKRRESGDNPGR